MGQSAVKPLKTKWPVVEVFGPTVQGEGVDQGVVAHFVRFGGCDFRCSWCDTPHAVLPKEVRANAERMDSVEITSELSKLPSWAPWIVLTGGNPALHDLSSLVDKLHRVGYLVSVETQGSRWREWMSKVDRLCVSPKPPSAGQEYDWAAVQRFLQEGLKARVDRAYEWLFLKIVIFTEEDLDFAEQVRSQFSNALLYLSAGNDAGRTVGNPTRKDRRTLYEVRSDLMDKTRWLTEEVFKRPALCQPDVSIQAQLHVGIWGNELGR